MDIPTHVLVIITLCIKWSMLCSSLNQTSFFYPSFDTNLTSDIFVDLDFYGAASVPVNGTPPVVNLVNVTTPLDDKKSGALLSRIPLSVWEYADGCVEQKAKVTGVDCVPGQAASFSFTFQIRLESLTKDFYGGKGMLFFLINDKVNPLNKNRSHFGIFPTDGKASQYLIWGVEFDTHQDVDVEDIDDNHVGIDYNTAVSQTVRSMADLAFDLNGAPVTVWIEYNLATSTLEVRLSNSLDRPADPFLQQTGLDIRNILGELMYPGFSAIGNDQAHQVILWSLESAVSHPFAGAVKPASPPAVTGAGSIFSTIFHLNFADFVKASGMTLLVGVVAFVAAVFLALRLTKFGQKLMLKMYAKVENNKCCSACCGLGVCVMCCTIPRDDPAASDVGKPPKTQKLEKLNKTNKTAKLGKLKRKGKREKQGKSKKKKKEKV